LNGIGGIAAGINGVPDHDLDFSRLHNEASLGQDTPASIHGNRQDRDLPRDSCYESSLFEFVNLPVGRPGPFGKHHYARVLGQPIDTLVNTLDCPNGMFAVTSAGCIEFIKDGGFFMTSGIFIP
jgi:hypothetical protein